ncbi:methyltransferase domain-containing protein [Pochonia chlamydosporia 170]|uniref:Methyltransferase domain-containing protein n=1 Tax=Pochonia chlamydosporia 170 TaxID=1380566 RepID=A0A179F192_METCM|nr:methyltransferase domain-containing protein [Pochonia chlamydosporia 170]OAQ59178.1 methyltransferase domain-containing protein [Pochonia chlamydosporia 170]
MSDLKMDDSVFWKLQNIESTYWDEYIATRPVYDAKIFRRVDDYRSSHSRSSSSTALDIGTGSGSAIEPLTKRFNHVVASDNDSTSLAFAKKRYSTVPEEWLSFTLSSGEELPQHHPPESFDLITCAETFPLMDTTAAMDNIYSLLRPGGTVAVWFYGPPFFTEADYVPKCQDILDAIMDHNFRPVVCGGDEARRSNWKRATDGKFSWLDYIPFPPERWTDVRRHKWNTHARLSFFSPAACDFPVETRNRVGDNETVTQEDDPSFWAVNWDVDMLRRFVHASFPKPTELGGPDEAMDRLFEQLAEAMGGNNVPRKLSWPAVLILAAKKV